MSSTRFPGKVLKPLLGEPMLFRQIERVSRAKTLDALIVATSLDPSDQPIEDLCRNAQIPFFRGKLEDVLDRFYQAAQLFHPDHIVRLTGDCPLSDPSIIDALVQFHLEGGYDYSSNCLEHSFPNGVDAEIMRMSALKTAWEKASFYSEREHVTPYLYKNRDKFKVGVYKNRVDLSRHRWTVDQIEDYELVKIIYEALYPIKPLFLIQDVLDYLQKNPHLNSLNLFIKRNEGYVKSIHEDRQIPPDQLK